MLRVRLVGEVASRSTARSRPLPPRPAARRCSRWLALNPGLHPRSAVAPRFWPDVLDESARASLRSALWALRRALGEDGALVATRDRVGLAPDDVWVDVLEAERLRADRVAARRRSRSAKATLLPGLEDEWVFEARDEHRDRTRRDPRAACRGRGAGGRPAPSGRPHAPPGRARPALGGDPPRRSCGASTAAGDRGAALAEFAELRSRGSLQTLARGAVGGDAGACGIASRGRAPGADRVPATAAAAIDTQLLRRARAGAELGSAARLAPSRRGEGPAQSASSPAKPGIGKTRLAARFAAESGAPGQPCSTAACEEQALVPFEPFAEAVGESAARRATRSSHVLLRRRRRDRLVLVLDDLQLGRPEHAGAARASRARRRGRAAARDRRVPGGRGSRNEPLLAAIAELRRDCDVERIARRGPRASTRSPIGVARDERRAVPARAIHDRTDGNPFFVRELARHLAEQPRTPFGDVPESVSDVVLARVERLSAAVPSVLTARVGARRVVRTLRARGGLGSEPDDLLDALDEASAAGLIDDAASGRYRFAHALDARRGLRGRSAPVGAPSSIAAPRPRSRACTASSRGRSSARSRCTAARAHGRRTVERGGRARRARGRRGRSSETHTSRR